MLKNKGGEFGFWNLEAPQIPLSIDLRGLQGIDLEHPFHLGEPWQQAELRDRAQYHLKVHLHTTITVERILLEESGCL